MIKKTTEVGDIIGRLLVMEFVDSENVVFDEIMCVMEKYLDFEKYEVQYRPDLSLPGLEIYRKLEQGQNGGSIDSLVMVANYYHISLDYLVYGEERDYISCLSEGLTDSQNNIVRATMASLIQNIKNFSRGNRHTVTK